MSRLSISLFTAITLLAPVLVQAPTQADECEPGVDGCVPTTSQCSSGDHDGLWLGENLFPGALCVSSDGQNLVYVGGDPALVCGAIIVADTTVVDTVNGDPNACGQSLPTISESGYIAMADGVQLRYSVIRPDVTTPVPVALRISPYSEGINPLTGSIADDLLAAGYAVAGVNLRGTGCSSGTWNDFQPFSDHYDIVEWFGAQPWSTGDVGMFGLSAAAMSQLYTAAAQPPSLRAIAPNEPLLDLYREHAHPGGIVNPGFAALWPLVFQPFWSGQAYPTAAAEGDAQCAANHADGNRTQLAVGSFQRAIESYRTQWYIDRSPGTYVDQVDVPVMTCLAWQDDQLIPQAAWLDQLAADTMWAIWTNGHHGACDSAPLLRAQTVAFFDAFVRGTGAGAFEEVPHVQVWHETSDLATPEPAWITTHDVWPPQTADRVFHLDVESLESETPPQDGSARWPPPMRPASPTPSGCGRHHRLRAPSPLSRLRRSTVTSRSSVQRVSTCGCRRRRRTRTSR